DDRRRDLGRGTELGSPAESPLLLIRAKYAACLTRVAHGPRRFEIAELDRRLPPRVEALDAVEGLPAGLHVDQAAVPATPQMALLEGPGKRLGRRRRECHIVRPRASGPRA